jgi:hypothetical protein
MCSMAASMAPAFALGCGQAGFEGEGPSDDQQRVEQRAGLDVDNVDDVDDTLKVVGGEITPVCGAPMTVKIPGCTATLVAPTILITARHCSPRAGMTVQFGEKAPFAFSVRATKCVSAPNSDAAYCVLPADERLRRVPTVPVLHGCEYTRFMKAGARLLGVGFGQTQGTGPARTKIAVDVPVVRVRDPFIDVGDRTHDLCFGDSGGGGFIHLVDGDKDWGWRTVGTVTGTARIPGGAPCGGTNYTSVLRHIRLIEENEDIDITPCTNEMGAWAPGPECNNILTDIETGAGAWPACTYGPKTTLAIDSCGMGAGPAPGTPPATPPPGTPNGGDASAGPDSSPGPGRPGDGGAGGAGSPAAPGAGSNPPAPATDPGAGVPVPGSAGAPGTGISPPPASPPLPDAKGRDAGATPPIVTEEPPVKGGMGCEVGTAAPRAGAGPLVLIVFALLGFRRRSGVRG